MWHDAFCEVRTGQQTIRKNLRKAIPYALIAILSGAAVFAQEPAAPPQSNPPSNSGAANSPAHAPVDHKGHPLPTFLIVGTVFDEKAISLPGVQLRIRRTDEKKFRWDTTTNSRGEFAVRVVPGHEYEVVTHAKKYKDQSKTVDAKVDVQQRLSIQLEPVQPSKTGAKP